MVDAFQHFSPAATTVNDVQMAQIWATFLAGFLGAIVGAVAAVVGPWWLKSSERKAEAKAAREEARRAAIIGWLDAALAAIQVTPENQGIPANEEASMMRALAEFTSLLNADEVIVDTWVRDAIATYTIMFVPRRWQLSGLHAAGRALIAWHRGDLPPEALVPYTVKWSGKLNRDVAVSSEEWPDWKLFINQGQGVKEGDRIVS